MSLSCFGFCGRRSSAKAYAEKDKTTVVEPASENEESLQKTRNPHRHTHHHKKKPKITTVNSFKNLRRDTLTAKYAKEAPVKPIRRDTLCGKYKTHEDVDAGEEKPKLEKQNTKTKASKKRTKTRDKNKRKGTESGVETESPLSQQPQPLERPDDIPTPKEGNLM